MTTRHGPLDQLAIDTIRTLSIDGVQQANSGHPGAPMGIAPMAYALWTRHLRHAPTQPGLAQPRPVRAVGRSRVDAPVLAAPPDRLRRQPRRPQVVPPVGLDHAGPPGVRPDAGRRGDDRPARPGPRQRGRDGDRRAPARRRVQPPRPRHRRPPDLRDRPRRRPAGGRRVRGRARSPATCDWQAVVLYDDNRIQLDGPTAGRSARTCSARFDGLRLAHPAGRGRHRRRRDLGGHRRRQGRRPAVDHRRPDPHRLRQPEQAGHPEGARGAARAPTRSGSPRRPTAGTRTARSTCRTRRASCSAARSTRARTSSPSGSRGSTATRRSSRPTPRSSGGGSTAGCPTAGTRACRRTRSATEVATRNASQDTIQALAGPLPELFGGSADLSESNLTDVKGDGPTISRPTTRAATCASASASTGWARSRTASPTTAASSPTARRS